MNTNLNAVPLELNQLAIHHAVFRPEARTAKRLALTLAMTVKKRLLEDSPPSIRSLLEVDKTSATITSETKPDRFTLRVFEFNTSPHNNAHYFLSALKKILPQVDVVYETLIPAMHSHADGTIHELPTLEDALTQRSRGFAHLVASRDTEATGLQERMFAATEAYRDLLNAPHSSDVTLPADGNYHVVICGGLGLNFAHSLTTALGLYGSAQTLLNREFGHLYWVGPLPVEALRTPGAAEDGTDNKASLEDFGASYTYGPSNYLLRNLSQPFTISPRDGGIEIYEESDNIQTNVDGVVIGQYDQVTANLTLSYSSLVQITTEGTGKDQEVVSSAAVPAFTASVTLVPPDLILTVPNALGLNNIDSEALTFRERLWFNLPDSATKKKGKNSVFTRKDIRVTTNPVVSVTRPRINGVQILEFQREFRQSLNFVLPASPDTIKAQALQQEQDRVAELLAAATTAGTVGEKPRKKKKKKADEEE